MEQYKLATEDQIAGYTVSGDSHNRLCTFTRASGQYGVTNFNYSYTGNQLVRLNDVIIDDGVFRISYAATDNMVSIPVVFDSLVAPFGTYYFSDLSDPSLTDEEKNQYVQNYLQGNDTEISLTSGPIAVNYEDLGEQFEILIVVSKLLVTYDNLTVAGNFYTAQDIIFDDYSTDEYFIFSYSGSIDSNSFEVDLRFS